MAGFLCVCVPSLYGVENLNVTGKVVDSSGEPLIGVSIKVENKNMGTTTDINGNFTLADIPKKYGACSYIYRDGDAKSNGDTK